MKIRHNILFEPQVTDTGSAPLAPAPSSVPTSSQPIKPVQASSPPPEVLKQTFSAEDMPELDASEGRAIIEDKFGREVKQPEVTSNSESGKPKQSKPVPQAKGAPSVATIGAEGGRTVAVGGKDGIEASEVPQGTEQVNKFLKAPSTEKKEDKPKVDSKQQVEKRVEVPTKDDVDYTSFSQQEVDHLKNMSKPARKFTADLIKQNRELAKNKDGVYYQHPQAYTLLPEYQQANEDISAHMQEGQYWESQLKLVKLGKPFRSPQGWDKNGKLVLGGEITQYDADDVEEKMRRQIGVCYNAGQQKQQQLQQFAGQFQQGIQRDSQLIEQERSKRFAWAADPKLLDYTIEIEGLGERSIKQIRDDIINVFPSYQRHTPGVQVCADLMVAMRLQAAELAEAKAQSSVSNTKLEEAQRAEPSSTGRPDSSGKSFGGVKSFDATILENM